MVPMAVTLVSLHPAMTISAQHWSSDAQKWSDLCREAKVTLALCMTEVSITITKLRSPLLFASKAQVHAAPSSSHLAKQVSFRPLQLMVTPNSFSCLSFPLWTSRKMTTHYLVSSGHPRQPSLLTRKSKQPKSWSSWLTQICLRNHQRKSPRI